MATTYTHTGNRAAVGYQHTGRNFDHHMKTSGKVHALNVIGYRLYTAVCGVTVDGDSSNDVHETFYKNPVELATVNPRVTCKACLRRKPVAVEVPKRTKFVVFIAACTGEVERWHDGGTKGEAERYAERIAESGRAIITHPDGYVLNAWVETRTE